MTSLATTPAPPTPEPSGPAVGAATSQRPGGPATAIDLLPGERHLLRGFPAKPIVAQRAENHMVWTREGRGYMDLGGASHGVALIGHNHPRVVAALRLHADRLLHVAQGIQSPERARFLELLHARLPAALSRTFIANSGAEAMECALKMAAVATGRDRFVAAQDSFHGRTAAALGVTHRPGFRDPFQAILPGCDFTPFNDEEALKAAVGPRTAAIVLEPVQGEGGIREATPAYLQTARDLATDRGALLVLDEIQSGLGRTGTFLASSPSGVEPDLVTLAKGLAGGLPIGVCSMTEAVAARLPPGGHGSTYGGAPLVCAVASEVLAVLQEERLEQRALSEGARLRHLLEGMRHPAVKAVQGRGLMVGLDLRIRPAAPLAALQERGFLALAGGGLGLRFLPPLTTPAAGLEALREALPGCLG
ncbi:MAG TPA: aminotransferase class III-fold pyridoxal phosphate-dependent enzyme [Candidatus Thermoplasmatota archaeon]|nr:aminotransferase class III-fold pyridoxal phosphate-dependent enzyme [Candidatus Thermoplasmatota archaeon]